MSKLNIDQKKIKGLFQDPKSYFLIPDYQRPYAWGNEECKTLWEDLFSFAFPNGDSDQFDESSEYFLGPIVTFKNSEGKMEIIDGQQRLTTLMLLLRAFYNRLDYMQDTNSKAMKADIEKCLWRADVFGNYKKDDLKINSEVATDEDKEEFLHILKDGGNDDMKSCYARNFLYFKKQIEQFINYYPTYFAYFPARILNNCVLLPIEAESQDTALRIFSTLNDRGKQLSDADIFKAQLYKHYSSLGKKDEFIATWKELDRIVTAIFHPTSGTPLDELFTRYMYYERALAGNKSSTTESLRKFYEKDNYALLKRETTFNNLVQLAYFWQDVYLQNRERFSDMVLRRLFVLNYAPNGMWTYITTVFFMKNKDADGHLAEEAFLDFLNKITAFIWAYALTNPGVNSLRTPIFAEMINIVNGNEIGFEEFKFNEDRFRTIFSTYGFSNNRAITKSIITWWAFSFKEQQLLPLETSFDIEHIYPKGRQQKENGLKDPNSIELLGNKSLLEQRINIRASDYRFSDKKRYYEGFSTNKDEKEGTKIKELQILSSANSDFTEKDIAKRNEDKQNGFVNYLASNNLIS
ncbi:MAG: DUF262 domain-containing HNH endonuclease family protein [Bacteroidales bacterium]|nr:DUF262 domain-containing HNH endonuclease family protein [Bacteroidales bacterium]